jgi:hypothetical protein
MIREPSFSTVYYGPGVKGWLHCGNDGCRWELSVAGLKHGPYHQAETELLLQPCGDDGLAIGGPVCLHCLKISLSRFPGGETYWGNAPLPPGIGPTLARRCHFRVRTIEIAVSPQSSDAAKIPMPRRPHDG